MTGKTTNNPLPAIDFSLPDPVTQRLRRTADLDRNSIFAEGLIQGRGVWYSGLNRPVRADDLMRGFFGEPA